MTKEKRYMTVDDVMKISYVEDPQISPDGKWIAYVVKNADKMDNGYKNDIYMVSTEGGEPIRLTRNGKSTSPRWSPDSGKLAFVTVQGNQGEAKPQIYILPVSHPGEARQLTSNENGASSPAWSPDGDYIAYLSSMNADERAKEDSDDKPEPPQDKLEGKHRSERKAEDEKHRLDPRPITQIPYRSGARVFDDRHAQIYVIATAEEDDVKPRRLTNANANYAAPVWSKSGRHIVTTRTWKPEGDIFFEHNNIYLIEFESSIERRITDEQFSYFNPKPSYDGDYLVALRWERGKRHPFSFALIPLEGSGSTIVLNDELDRSISGYDWLEDGNLLVIVETEGRYEIHKLNPKTKEFTALITEEQSIYGFNVQADGKFAYVSRTTSRLDELFFQADAEAQQMTEVNQAFMEEIEVIETHEIRYQNSNGEEIQGWYLLPPNYEEGKKYPLALNIHGGPEVMWSPSSRSIWHEWQTHAAEGYVVFYCNPRGSSGYGFDFQTAILSNWGDLPMGDIMAGVDTMIEKGIVDDNRMVLSGGSYGGYMVAWVIGHTDRFKAAVGQRGVYNLNSFFGTTDNPNIGTLSFEAEPWEDHEKLWEHSPLKYAPNIKTPTLIIHSENDFRVPIEQGEQLFAWIRRATDTPVKLIRYPREGHELSRSGEPKHRISRLTEMMNWFKQYCPTD